MAIQSAQDFLEAAAKRRSIYTINSDSPLSNSEIESIVKRALVIAPSPWNTSSSRAVILFGDNHRKVFDEYVYPMIEAAIPAPAFENFGPRIKGYAKAAGCVLVYEDLEAIEGLKQKQPMAAPMADEWSDVASGMFQYLVWTALSVGGLGASLQHFNFHPGIVAAISREFGIQESWKLKAQIVFGTPTAEPGERSFPPSAPLDQRIKVAA